MLQFRQLLLKLIPTLLLVFTGPAYAASMLLNLLGITPSAQSVDYVNNKKQFQLYSLLTEQSHPKTRHLSYQISRDTYAGLQSLLAVDQDITHKFNEIANDPQQLKNLQKASLAIQTALEHGHKVYFYGTGSTGRLSEAIESSLWRPFWQRVMRTPEWDTLKAHLFDIQNRLKGEITGGDRALISSLEGFEDLQIIGKLQLADNKIVKNDVVFAVTEGGETSAVIGTILAAAQLYTKQSPPNLYFIYNNPDECLRPFDRSRAVLDNPLIRKINLTTGPQAISGSTRMQATTASLYVSGIILEDAIHHLLQRYLAPAELKSLGFNESATIKQRLLDFADIQQCIYDSAAQIVPWTVLEAQTYATHHHATYFAQQALLPVFVDVTERAPTFNLEPLDPISISKKLSWIQVWSPTDNSTEAWQMLLGRPFHGLQAKFYQAAFNQIADPYLKEAALKSLSYAGEEQQYLYDLSFSKNNQKKSDPVANDLGVMVLLSDEPISAHFNQWLQLFVNAKSNLTIVVIAPTALSNPQIVAFKHLTTQIVFLQVLIPQQDPFGLNQIIGLKMLLNAHSTAVMAKLSRVVGNTMTDVKPSNLKLIGRATYLIQLHVNIVLKNPLWIKTIGKTASISFTEANAVLFDAINYQQTLDKEAPFSSVELSIVRILESLKQHKNISWQQTQAILTRQALASYLFTYER